MAKQSEDELAQALKQNIKRRKKQKNVLLKNKKEPLNKEPLNTEPLNKV